MAVSPNVTPKLHPAVAIGDESSAASPPASPTRAGSLGLRSSASFRQNAVIEELKRKIGELEGKLFEKEHAQKSMPDSEKLTQELAVARKNNEILQGNVETLKALAVQLATQLEETNLQVATLQEKQHTAALQLERDVSYEIDGLRQEYERRLEELRLSLEQSQAKLQETLALAMEKERRAEQQFNQVLREKEAMIGSMMMQLEVAREQLAQLTKQEQELRASKNNAQRLRSLRLQRERAALELANESMLSDAELLGGMKTVLSFTLAVPRSEVEQVRRIRGVGVPPPAAQHFHADVTNDPTVLFASGEVDLADDRRRNTSARFLANAAASVVDSPQTGHTWKYTSPAGESVSLTLTIDRNAQHLA